MAAEVLGTPEFAIVIPTYNEEQNLARLLQSIHSQTGASYCVAVVDQGSSDRTVEIALSFGCTVIELPRAALYTGLARSRNAGAHAIPGTLLLHLDADMELGSPTFLLHLRCLFSARHRAVSIHETDVAVGFWASCKALERSFYRGTTMEAARAVTRDLFAQAGGYDESVAAGEDFIVTRLYGAGTVIASGGDLVLRHHLGHYSLRSILRKKFIYGRTARSYLRRARAVGARSGGSIVRSSIHSYFASWPNAIHHPLTFAGILPMRILEFVALSLGMLVNYPPTAASTVVPKATSQTNHSTERDGS